MKIYQSSQDYLETILVLNEKLEKKVRSIDIANELNITKQSVHRAIKNLNENNYLTVNEKGYISLTQTGLDIAKDMLERHTILSEYFSLLGVNNEVASEDACKVEHYISKETFEAIKKHLNTLKEKM